MPFRIFTPINRPNNATSYPQSLAAAQSLGRVLANQLQRGTVTVATLGDCSTLLTLGYCTATAQRGAIRVYGVPYGQAITGMRCYVRSAPTGNRFLFNGFAPSVNVGMSSGAVIVTTADMGATVPVTANSAATLPVTTTLDGYYWTCFFYTPQLPATTLVLWDWQQAGTAAGVRLCYTPQGKVLCTSYGMTPNWSITAQGLVAPHSVAWLVVQPGNTTPLLANGSALTGTIISGVPAWPTGTTTVLAHWLNASDGTLPANVPGLWLSKVSWGYAVQGGVPRMPTTSVPQQDSAIPLGAAPIGQGVTTIDAWLTPAADQGGTTLSDSGPVPIPCTVQTTVVTVTSIGPY